MSLEVAFRRAARSEFDEATARYEAQRVGLGVEFTAEIDRCVALAAEHPQLYAVVRQNIRRVTANRFLFSIYFISEPRRIVVLSVFHGRRDPAIWQTRV